MNEMAKCIYRSSAHMPFHAWNVSVDVDIKKETRRYCFLCVFLLFCCRNFDFRSINHQNGTLHETHEVLFNVANHRSLGKVDAESVYMCTDGSSSVA